VRTIETMSKLSLRFAFFFVYLLSVTALGGAVDSIQQAQVEAAFIYQFRNYITWPNESEADDSRHFVISIIGRENRLFQELEKLAKTKKMKNRLIEVRAVESVSKIPKSDIVIVGSSDVDLLQDVARKVKGEHTLLVSHAADFAKKGAMINFFLEDDRLRFEINPSAIKKEDLQVGSQLLNLARVIND